MDGGPHQVIAPGTTWSPEFQIRQPASTLWYHSHMLHQTGRQVYHGLAGLIYVEDEVSAALQLPDTYGVDDIPLVIQDRAFHADGSFLYDSSTMGPGARGMMGDVALVNGVPFPTLKVQRRRTRFRILNGSNARIYNLEFSDQRRFLQIASDGGLLRRRVPLRRLRLAPGERAEIVVVFDWDDDVYLRNLGDAPGGAGTGGDELAEIIHFDGTEMAGALVGPPPVKLASIPAWSPRDAAKTRRFVLGGRRGQGRMGRRQFTINGKSMDMSRIDETVQVGDIEVWEVVNRSPMPHPFHIHDVQFRIHARNGRTPLPNERSLKDTVLVSPGETVRLIMKFEDYADSRSPYMYHCHILEHEDAGMMGQFVVKA